MCVSCILVRMFSVSLYHSYVAGFFVLCYIHYSSYYNNYCLDCNHSNFPIIATFEIN